MAEQALDVASDGLDVLTDAYPQDPELRHMFDDIESVNNRFTRVRG